MSDVDVTHNSWPLDERANILKMTFSYYVSMIKMFEFLLNFMY